MPNCTLQEAVITITQTSKYGQPYDTAHVETIFLLDAPVPAGEIFLVPGDEFIPNEIMQIMRLGKVDFTPMPRSEAVANLSDFSQEVEQQNKEAAIADAALGLAAVYMKPIQFKPEQNTNFYRLSYDYTIYPDPSGNFYVYTKLPFRSFQTPAGGQVRLIVVLPTGAQYDPAATKGIALNGQTVEEQQAVAANGRQVISFFWQNDPDFTVKYKY